MRHLIYGTVLMVGGCGQSPSNPAPKVVVATETPTKAALDPNILILKCTGDGSSVGKIPGTQTSSDPANEEIYIRANVRDQTLQTWIVGRWTEACDQGSKCGGTFSKSKLTYSSVLNEQGSGDFSNSTETWSISRGDGQYSHVDEIVNRSGGKLMMTRKVTIRGTCAKVDEPAPDDGL